jgi:hypothetical protein
MQRLRAALELVAAVFDARQQLQQSASVIAAQRKWMARSWRAYSLRQIAL